MTFRAAIWTAVSTERQAAPDRTSLKVQEDEARAKITSHGWQEVAGPFVVDGESRTRWVSLYHAEKSIPALRNMLDAAEKGKFDILVLYDFNRFRSLLKQVFDVLCDYGVQMYTVKAPQEPVQKYDDKAKGAMATLINVHMLMSENQTSNLSIYFEDGMSRKVLEQGLHPGTGPIPYGYRKPAGHEYDKKSVFEPSADAINVIKMKDWYLSGLSAWATARKMNEAGIPPPRGARWVARGVTRTLQNPFYAGLVTWGSTDRQRIRRDGSFTVTAKKPRFAKGRHKPLWDEATYKRLLDEFERRGRTTTAVTTRPLSRLLYCWCGKYVTVQQKYKSKNMIPGDFYYLCSTRKAGHFVEKSSTLLPRFADDLAKFLREVENVSELPPRNDLQPELEARKKDLIKRRQRWMDDYESGKVEAEDYTKRTKELSDDIKEIEVEISETETVISRAKQQREILETFIDAVDRLPKYVVTEDPAQVNTDLHAFIKAVRINDTGKFEIELKF